LGASSHSEPNRDDDLLDEFSLGVVLAMLAVMETAEELTQLECLTDAQKRQVWDATPEAVKTRLKQLRAEARSKAEFQQLQAEAIAEIEAMEAMEAAAEERAELAEISEAEIGEAEAIEETEALLEAMDEEMARLPFQSYEAAPTIEVGDWVLLKAVPQLTAAELKAVWEVVKIQGGHAWIESKGMGSRSYPLVWMVLYPELEF
jgi:hypothetical protein